MLKRRGMDSDMIFLKGVTSNLKTGLFVIKLENQHLIKVFFKVFEIYGQSSIDKFSHSICAKYVEV